MILASHGIIASSGVSQFDADAQAFITAASISDSTQQTAINTLVTDLKGYNIWTKMKAIYPFVGGTASTHKWNLKDPRDLDAAYRLVFNGGWTHSSTGAKPNGTTAFADTKFNMNTNITPYSMHLAYYSREDIIGENEVVMGVGNNLGYNAQDLGIKRNVIYTAQTALFDASNASALVRTGYTNTDGRGLFIGSITANNSRKIYKNTSIVATNTTTATHDLPNANMYIGAYNNYDTGIASAYTNKQTAFASIGNGLTDTESANLYLAVQSFNTTLSRQI
jgi:hypothetical protein